VVYLAVLGALRKGELEALLWIDILSNGVTVDEANYRRDAR